MNLCGRGKGGDNGSWWILNALKKKASRKEAILLLLRMQNYFIPGMPVCGLTWSLANEGAFLAVG